MSDFPYGRILRRKAKIVVTTVKNIATIHETANRLKRLEGVIDGYGASILGLHRCTNRHENMLTVLNAMTKKISDRDEESYPQKENNTELINNIEYILEDNENIRSRIEFIRKELMFELRKNLKICETSDMVNTNDVKPKVLNNEKCNTSGPKRLNLGCGHIPLDQYINVDTRELPGVDLIANVTSLPYNNASVDEIYAAHLVEHFSYQSLKSIILPHWHDILIDGGQIVLVAPNAKSMIDEYKNGELSFEVLREVVFGGQEYNGDFHFTMLEPITFAEMLKDIGFQDVVINVEARKNGLCYEFEIQGKKKTINSSYK